MILYARVIVRFRSSLIVDLYTFVCDPRNSCHLEIAVSSKQMLLAVKIIRWYREILIKISQIHKSFQFITREKKEQYLQQDGQSLERSARESIEDLALILFDQIHANDQSARKALKQIRRSSSQRIDGIIN